MDINIGFTWRGLRYGWHKNQLYRLPFLTKQKLKDKTIKRQYTLKKLNKIKIGNKEGFRLSSDKLTEDHIDLLNKKVDWKINLM